MAFEIVEEYLKALALRFAVDMSEAKKLYKELFERKVKGLYLNQVLGRLECYTT